MRKKKTIKKTQLRRSMTDLFELPMDITLDLPLITLIGFERIQIENHRGVIEYKSDCVRLNTTAGVVRFAGEGLVVHDIGSEDVMLTGRVSAISFE